MWHDALINYVPLCPILSRVKNGEFLCNMERAFHCKTKNFQEVPKKMFLRVERLQIPASTVHYHLFGTLAKFP